MKEIKQAMNDQESKESIHQLTVHLEEHKNQTATELAQLQTSLTTTLDNITHQLQDVQRDVKRLLGPYTCGGTGGW